MYKKISIFIFCLSAFFLVTGTWANNLDLVKFKNKIIKQRKNLKKPSYVLNNINLKKIAALLPSFLCSPMEFSK